VTARSRRPMRRGYPCRSHVSVATMSLPSAKTDVVTGRRCPAGRAINAPAMASARRLLCSVLAVVTPFAATSYLDRVVLAAPPAASASSARAPEMLEHPAPAYPEGGAGAAVVVLEVTVARDGSVKDVKVLSGDAPFTTAAVDAVRAWTFRPAMRGEKAIVAKIPVRLTFDAPATPEPSARPSASSTAPAAIRRARRSRLK
jgi:TonB family protein